jgi:hypothetical protein
MKKRLCDSIRDRRIIEFHYEGGIRVVEPHCYGLQRETGEEVLLGYQTGGHTRTGGVPDWRLYEVSRISGLKITDISFLGPRSGYNPEDPRFSEAFCKL